MLGLASSLPLSLSSSTTKKTAKFSPSCFTAPKTIAKSIIGGQHHVVSGPFGKKPIVYADSTASGRALSFVEDYIQDCVLPFYANTHTEASATGLQTSQFREDARDAVRRACNAPSEDYAVIFCGSGSTGAMTKLAGVLGISPLAASVEEDSERPVVFISAQEHHSNELLWRESPNVDCVVIPQDPTTGLLDEAVLLQELLRRQDRPFRLASLSAASNVTGIRCDTSKVTQTLHQYNALAVWDFAAAGPHGVIDVQGQDMDGLYLSPHKYVGGPGTPGVLIARHSLFNNNGVPVIPGGGTVAFVQPHGRKYLQDPEVREEGGTPAIVESIRCGLALQLHLSVGPKWIERQEACYLQKALGSWKKNPNIALLGNTDAKRVAIVSFRVQAPSSKKDVRPSFLHHNFVVALLNDLLGIQSRGGCSCAGPYGHLLLGIDAQLSDLIFHEKIDTLGEAVRPGWIRVGFSYYMDGETVDYIINAVNLVAKEGYKLLPFYALNGQTGAWTHVGANKKVPMRLWDFRRSYSKPTAQKKKDLKACLAQAKKILKNCAAQKYRNVSEAFLSKEFTTEDDNPRVTWFVVSEELHDSGLLQKKQQRPGCVSETQIMSSWSSGDADDSGSTIVQPFGNSSMKTYKIGNNKLADTSAPDVEAWC